jgi:RHS repeat-associated protein
VDGLTGGLVRAFDYDTSGRLTAVTDAAGWLSRVQDPSGGEHTLTTSADGLLQALAEPVGRSHGYTFDPLGRLTEDRGPGGAVITLSRAGTVGSTTVTTTSALGRARRYGVVTLPDGGVRRTVVEASGATRTVTATRTATLAVEGDPFSATALAETATEAGRTWRAGDSAATRTWTVTSPSGRVSTQQLDAGGRPVALTPPGLTPRTFSYDSFGRIVGSAEGAGSRSFGYDADGLLAGLGSLTVTRDATTGLPAGTALGVVTTVEGSSAFGEPASLTASAGATALYGASYTRDPLARITGVTETVQGATRSVGYGYDASGRLASVTVDGALAASYGYDSHGNRTSLGAGAATVGATFDGQDRLLAAGATSYGWAPTGTLASRSGVAGTTSYQHDALGRLRSVLLPDGRQLDYLLDGLGRRIGKRVDGALVEAFLHDGVRPVAWLDGAGAVRAVFVYRPERRAPDNLVSGAGTFRFVPDQLGSPRLVVDTSSGAVVQRLDDDAFGVVVADSNPGFQPFGFAGGLRDLDTGQVHFGAGDYDPATGRWTSKDPLGLAAGDSNRSAYVGNDPVNWLDPSGLRDVCATRRRVRPGDTLFVPSHHTTLLDASNASAPLLRHIQANEPVIFRGTDPTDSRFVLVEQGGQAGYVLASSLSTRNFLVETLPGIPQVGQPMSNQAFPSHGAGTKG